ncbi:MULTISPECIES: hypothetical protein [unclassified Mesorhizobium]|uniref:DUF7662 domain-containing protein n=1 Tax=unclassified Mesorhizobium TaxID=325217 RepID=UPI000BAF2DF7|nr:MULTISPECIES: hypothetical protein [unclassified Mesorhizobium]PBB43452.1 hypothetical protein CK222_11830 [Mesorhizobium sp. WSM3866]RUV99189.1 hypothetical protein EOA49_20965 [Mesorhizobium sp. M1A.F.Ca.IN.020.04.1.1]RUW08945.1 hypothetical protein EOA53_17680 [Mesorhizobium sp. M1A.F.Ca.IN.020.03.1.1]RWF75824.1 MAG: hypothetical protein EOQ34_00660 [Mesorhizobium sp.]RWG12438.1 MAG: hypothetical protein EOQ58_21020 [Mesorhizobium sp.]
MGKYSPLRSYLMAQTGERVPMSFSDIEKLLGEKLPASKQYPAWWSNNPSNNPMTKEWLAAGFQTESVNIAGENLVFRRVQPGSGTSKGFGESAQAEIGGTPKRHPIFGCMKGTLTILPEVDLTEPVEQDWGKVYEH